MKQIILKGVSKVYNPSKESAFYALKNIDLEIQAGECVIVKGISGSGKSTLLSLIGALSKPSEGEILVNGQNIAKLPDAFSSEYRHKHVGCIFQSFNLLNGLSVYHNVMAPLMLTSLTTQNIEQNVERALMIANIAHKKMQNVADLSGGEKQRCAIARAIVMDPSIILADEPTANLDAQNSLLFLEMIHTFKEMGKTVIIATHDTLFEACADVDRCIQMKDGVLLS